jgi:mycofactocin system glycosyltransferase
LTPALPPGLRLALDPAVRTFADGRVLVGGAPGRILRLSEAGRAGLQALQAGSACSPATRRLGRRLVDAGMAHPRPRPRAGAASDATIVIPVRDRAPELGRCLASLTTGSPVATGRASSSPTCPAGGAASVVVVDDGSADAAAVAAVCRRYGARLVVATSGGGPAAARNRALLELETEWVAFLDSDCQPAEGWIDALAGHFDDPLVAAVGARIRPVRATRRRRGSVRDRYDMARCALDMGERESDVGPGRRVAYLPTAALLVRRAALATGFDPDLRYGEDVDLVWRLCAAGWRVRYDPAVVVGHAEPDTWAGLLKRRFRYGTSAAPLARRHPGRLPATVLRPRRALACGLALAGRPVPALAVIAASTAVLARRLRGTGVPAVRAPGWAFGGAARTLAEMSRASTVLAGPALLVLGARAPRARLCVLALLAAGPLREWQRRRPPIDPVRWTLASFVDDCAYGAGVWRGCADERTIAPVRPSWRPEAGRAESPIRPNG